MAAGKDMGAALVMALAPKGKPKADAGLEDDDESTAESDKLAAVRELMDAFKAGDEQSAMEALDAYTACGSSKKSKPSMY